MMSKKKRKLRRILVNGVVIKTRKSPKYIFGLHGDGVWHYVFKNELHTHYVHRPRQIIVSRFTKREIEHLQQNQRKYSRHGSLFSKLRSYKFKEFRRTIGEYTSFRYHVSLDDWLDYFNNELTNDEFKKSKLKEILKSEN